MGLPRRCLEAIIYGTGGGRRFTQDSPILPDVWIRFGQDPEACLDLLITPRHGTAACEVASTLRSRLEETGASEKGQRDHELAYTPAHVAVKLGFRELIQVVLPMTPWWQNKVLKHNRDFLAAMATRDNKRQLANAIDAAVGGQKPAGRSVVSPPTAELVWLARIVGVIAYAGKSRRRPARQSTDEQRDAPKIPTRSLVAAFAEIVKDIDEPEEDGPEVWLVNRNRDAALAIWHSCRAIKADAAQNVFKLRFDGLAWAVIDDGIDARHPAFRLRDEDGRVYPEPFEKGRRRWRNRTRVVATYDFTGIRHLLDPNRLDEDRLPENLRVALQADDQEAETLRDTIAHLRRSLQKGRHVDWGTLEPLIRVPHQDGLYRRSPPGDHGTHVAGILAADWDRDGDRPLRGMCPELRLYDLRVIRPDGSGHEFNVIAALQFVRYLNSQRDYRVIHGANLSLSIHHDVANYACGRTPVCDECERLVGTGVVVVAAAGNRGYLRYTIEGGLIEEGYHTVSITDPGNAEGVITVGATHREYPHTYGVSYFSSRGPTGDGRCKPDLVAPGEKIVAPVPPEDYEYKDGTSMAAPHVSGAAAILMARHSELIGQPARIKQVLCDSATDLGRERYFQGAGMLDILRALQSI